MQGAIVSIILVAAAVYVFYWIYRSARAADGNPFCGTCPLKEGCHKPKEKCEQYVAGSKNKPPGGKGCGCGC